MRRISLFPVDLAAFCREVRRRVFTASIQDGYGQDRMVRKTGKLYLGIRGCKKPNLYGTELKGVIPVTNDLNLTDRRRADTELVRSALAGNEEAFATLFNAHRTKVYSLCLRMTSNTAEAEDLTQDAFLQVFRKLGTFRGDSALSTWLYRVAVNTVLMHFRKKGLRQVSLEEPANREAGAPKREHGKTDERLSTSVDRIALTRAMKELPVGYRTIFLMHEVKGYEHHEIARLLRCSVGNSKSQLHKAKARMRELLGMQRAQDAARTARKVPVEVATMQAPVEALSWQSAKEAAA